jgi:FkbM family methyltransferase
MELTLEEYEKVDPRAEMLHEGVKMIFSTPSAYTLWRVRSIYEKEPWTLDWIAGFEADEVLVDCGANVGMYTIWAAATRRARVYAFEPEAQNYATLNRNVRLNDLADRVTAYCIGLSDQSGLSTLYLSDVRIGASCHALGEPLDFQHQPLHTVFRQGSIAASLDDLVERGAIPVPQHIKIDVDGFEPKVIAGARRTLANTAVRSLLVETNQNLDDHLAMIGELENLGFRHDMAQVARAERKDGAFEGVADYVFRR